MQKLRHEIDPWGYYCETYCKACAVEKYKCFTCGTVYGSGQRHATDDCNAVFAAEDAKQLVFPFMTVDPWKSKWRYK